MTLVSKVQELLTDWRHFWKLAGLVLFGELVLNIAIVERVPYTEIDWIAYMQEVRGFLGGELNYTNMRGDTGPLVYPAGFVYLFSFLNWITNDGLNIHFAQYIWLTLYLSLLTLALLVYRKSKISPPWSMILLCLSYRIHSLFVLRLFNDCWATTFFYMSALLFLSDYWSIGCLFYSLAVSIKMSVLLYAPGLLVLLIQRFGLVFTIPRLAICGIVQLLLGLPFLLSFPIDYIRGAFDLGRVFTYIWSVNWKFVPEEIFISKPWALLLLFLQVSFLLFFAIKKWNAFSGNYGVGPLNPKYIMSVLVTSNFIGIVFSRTLHYQFYTWFFHTLPAILWLTPYNPIFKFCVVAVLEIELMFNVYPSNPLSSGVLVAANIITLLGLVFYRHFPQVHEKQQTTPDNKKQN